MWPGTPTVLRACILHPWGHDAQEEARLHAGPFGFLQAQCSLIMSMWLEILPLTAHRVPRAFQGGETSQKTNVSQDSAQDPAVSFGGPSFQSVRILLLCEPGFGWSRVYLL